MHDYYDVLSIESGAVIRVWPHLSYICDMLMRTDLAPTLDKPNCSGLGNKYIMRDYTHMLSVLS